jgi:NAD(P)-dependent dehydrogenase (short-subunit alcohol dehydrogenase family)
MRLEGLKVLITGGASGLGAATASRFVKASSQVAIWDLNAELGSKKAAEIGGRFYQTDITSQESVKASFDQTVRDLGRIDFVLNSAGVWQGCAVLGVPVEEVMQIFEKTLMINTYGTYLTTILVVQQMSKQSEVNGERGVIINIASLAATQGDFFASAYSASKGAVAGMTMALARDFSTHKIRINTIAPGLIVTPIMDGLPEPVIEAVKSQSTTLSLGEPDDFAHFVQTIVENKFMSGTVFPFDAGMTPFATRNLPLLQANKLSSLQTVQGGFRAKMVRTCCS